MIIPVVLRGFDQFPREIADKRQVHRFDGFGLSDRELFRNLAYNAQVRKLAEYIAGRCRDLAGLEIDCEGFAMPAEPLVHDTVRRLSGQTPPFPGREGVHE